MSELIAYLLAWMYWATGAQYSSIVGLVALTTFLWKLISTLIAIFFIYER